MKMTRDGLSAPTKFNIAPIARRLILNLTCLALTTASTTTLAATESPKPSDLFNCTKALYKEDLMIDMKLNPKNDARTYSIKSLPVDQTQTDRPHQAFVVNVGKVIHKGKGRPGFAILTRDTVSCQQLTKPSVDHGAGSIWENYAYEIPRPREKAANTSGEPNSKMVPLKFNIVVHRENEPSRRFLDAKIEALEEQSSPTTKIKPFSCFDPESQEYRNTVGQITRLARLRIADLTLQIAARRDIRAHSKDGATLEAMMDTPPPAFLPKSEILISAKGLRACRRIQSKTLNLVLDQYEKTAAKIDSESASERPSDHASPAAEKKSQHSAPAVQ